jgi:hypothetical protein
VLRRINTVDLKIHLNFDSHTLPPESAYLLGDLMNFGHPEV